MIRSRKRGLHGFGLGLTFARVMLAGCSTRAWYDGLRTQARQACLMQPDAERPRCESRLPVADFDRYQTQRIKQRPQ